MGEVEERRYCSRRHKTRGTFEEEEEEDGSHTLYTTSVLFLMGTAALVFIVSRRHAPQAVFFIQLDQVEANLIESKLCI